MRFQILHESAGRVRLKAVQYAMSMEQADILETWILALPGVRQVTVHERLGSLIIIFSGDREELYSRLSRFSYEQAGKEVHVLSADSRRINREYKEKMVFQVLLHYAKRLFIPMPVRKIINTIGAVPRIWMALEQLAQFKINVEVLDGIAIGTSLVTGDFATAGSVRFLLGLGDTLDAWTHKKSVDDLAKNMSLNVDQVWMIQENGEKILVPVSEIQTGSRVIVNTGNVLPLDGIIEQGDVMINQASLTGESVPVEKHKGSAVYAGTVIEEGNCVIRVMHTTGENRYDRIVRMIEESERLKSGSGKSTCARLAARLWDVTEGSIRVGGTDISTVDPEVLLSDYSMVFQDVVLFDDTVMENIRLGRHGATDEEVLAAAAAANCDEFALKLPQGYATPIGENGTKLSGGERQRISIARALLKDAPIVLLDEATASLDVENETKVQEALSRLLGGKTVLVIAHRMRTVESADKIIVLCEGRVAEEGSPDELLAKEDGIFRRMIQLQSASAGWSI